MIEKETIKGIGVTTLSFDEIIGKVCEYIDREEKRKIIVCANPHSIVLSKNDDEFFHTLNDADICLPDGTGVVLASKLMGGSIRKRIAGPDFFVALTEYANGNGVDVRYFFLGSTAKSLVKIKEKMKEMYPHVIVDGTYAPPMGEWSKEENERIADMISKSSANVLWVGLGAPKQEKWIYQNRDKLNVSVIAAIGAAFDFFAGTKKRSPKVFRDLGLEWLPRFVMEPKRLWKRNVISTPKFLFLVLKEKIMERKSNRVD